MRCLCLTLAASLLALSLPCIRAQDAVLVLTPSPTTTVAAGTGSAGYGGDGNSASAAQLAAPSAMARDAQGNIFLADTRNHRIRRIAAADGTISTIAGTGVQGFAGDEGPATQAQLDSPGGVAVLTDGTLVIVDTHNHRLRRVDAAGNIHTIAGTGTRGYSGDGAAATAAQLNGPLGVAAGLAGDLYIADAGNHCIRHLGADGTISTVAGDGTQGDAIDGAPATSTHLNLPVAVTVRADGSVLITDRGSNRILILQTDGTLHTLNTASVSLRRPSGTGTNSFGDTLIADTGNFRVAQISSSGAGSVLGSGEQGAPNPALAPIATAFGATASVLGTNTSAAPGQIAVLDRDHSQLLQVSLPRLAFADTVVATASLPRSVVLRNAGTTALSVTSIGLPAPFTTAATSTCGSAPFQLAANANCQLDLLFTPSTIGAVSTVLEVNIANGPPQRVTLLGNGLRTGTQLASSVSLQTSGTLNYAGVPLAITAAVLGSSTTAATGNVTFLDGTTVLGTSPLNPSAQATLTTAALATGAHTLSARYSGDALYLPSTSAASALTITLAPDFTATASNTAPLILHSGNPGALSLTLQPSNGVLNRVVTITVDGLPPGTAINVTPIPITLASDPVPVNIAFKLPVSLSQAQPSSALRLVLLAPFLLFLPARRRASALLLVALAVLPLALQGCGGGYLGGQSVTAQSATATYPVTVTATCTGVTGGTLTHTASFTVEVQP
ncbi:hypothetical protein GCM10022270_28070 [Terriglobus aquaticus]